MWISFSNLIADCEYSQNNLNHNTLVLVNIVTSLPKGSLRSSVARTQHNSTQREFTNAGETPHCPHLFIKIKYKTIRHILFVLIYLQFRLGRP